jgi:hypothetical protein
MGRTVVMSKAIRISCERAWGSTMPTDACMVVMGMTPLTDTDQLPATGQKMKRMTDCRPANARQWGVVYVSDTRYLVKASAMTLDEGGTLVAVSNATLTLAETEDAATSSASGDIALRTGYTGWPPSYWRPRVTRLSNLSANWKGRTSISVSLCSRPSPLDLI